MNDYLLYCSLLIGIVSLFVACFAITGYIKFRNQSIPIGSVKNEFFILSVKSSSTSYKLSLPVKDYQTFTIVTVRHKLKDNCLKSIIIDDIHYTNNHIDTTGKDMVINFNIENLYIIYLWI